MKNRNSISLFAGSALLLLGCLAPFCGARDVAARPVTTTASEAPPTSIHPESGTLKTGTSVIGSDASQASEVSHIAHQVGQVAYQPARALITEQVDDKNLITVQGDTRPEASRENDQGPVADDFRLEHMMLLLKRSPEREHDLETFIRELHTNTSPLFHHWIRAKEFGQRFGSNGQDLTTITHWLESQGFQVNLVYPNQILIDFSGTARQVRNAFHTDIHKLTVKGEEHFANMTDPKIPAALAPAVVGVVSLHDFRPVPLHTPPTQYTGSSGCTLPNNTTTPKGDPCYFVAPADLATIYNLNPLFSGGITGKGQTIALVEDSDVYDSSDWATFRSNFGLSGYSSGSYQQINPAPPNGPNNCTDPGANSNATEASIDVEWASASAPDAAIELVSCADGPNVMQNWATAGFLIALENLLNQGNEPPAIVSMSYGLPESIIGATANAVIKVTYQQAVAAGVSLFVASGDGNAAGTDRNASYAQSGINISGFATTPYNVAVGGTDFGDTYAKTNATYWNTNNGPNYGSANSYIPEIPWNDSCASSLLANFLQVASTYGSQSLCNQSKGSSYLTVAGGSGGPSACATGSPSTPGVVGGTCTGYGKPWWQSGLGVPPDGVRDVPDVSLFAADSKVWDHGYLFCAGCASSGNFLVTGGTSFASPIMAGIQALINQKTRSRWGNPNPIYYELANAEYGSTGNNSCNSTLGNSIGSGCIFNDITLGDIDVACGPLETFPTPGMVTIVGTFNCYDSSTDQNGNVTSFGVLSTSNTAFQPAYAANTGWDFATGLGSINAANLVNGWPSWGFSVSPDHVTITPGGTQTVELTVYNAPFVTFTAICPGWLTSNSCNGVATGSSTTITLTAQSNALVDSTVPLVLSGTYNGLTVTADITVTVVGSSAANFNLSASPNTLTIKAGSSGQTTISVGALNGFNSPVSLFAAAPNGFGASLSPATTSGASTLTLNVPAGTQSALYPVTIVGTSVDATATTNTTVLNVSVPQPPCVPNQVLNPCLVIGIGDSWKDFAIWVYPDLPNFHHWTFPPRPNPPCLECPVVQDLRSSLIPTQPGNLWVIWQNDPTDSYAINVWAHLGTDSVTAIRAFLAAPRAQLGLPPSSSLGANLITFPDGSPDSTVLQSDVYTLLTNRAFTAAVTTIRPEDALFATKRALSPLNTNTYAGLGYGTGPSTLIGSPLRSYYSTATTTPVAFNIMGSDPFTHSRIPVWRTIELGAAPIVLLANRTAALRNVINANLSEIATLWTGQQCNGSVFGLPSNPLTVNQDSPLSGIMNGFEFTNIRLKSNPNGSQEQGVNPAVSGGNPLSQGCTSGGGTRRRTLGTRELINFGIKPIPDSLGYALFSFADFASIAGSSSYGYLTLNGVDPIQSHYTDGTLPTCIGKCPVAPGTSFPNLRNGTYRSWSMIRILTDASGPNLTTSLSVARTAQNAATTTVPDFVPFNATNGDPGLHLYRSHFLQSGVSPNNGLNGQTEKGGDMGGCIEPVSTNVLNCHQ